LQLLSSMNGSMKTIQSGQASQGGNSESFGSVFAALTTTAPIAGTLQVSKDTAVSIEAIQALFDSKDLEGLLESLQTISGTETVEPSENINTVQTLGTVESIAEVLAIDPEKLIDSVSGILKEAGVSEDKLEELCVETPIWTLLSLVDEVAPAFFGKLNEVLGKQNTFEDDKRNATVDVLKAIKYAELLAPKTDMTISMEQKLESIKSALITASTEFSQQTSVVNAKTDIVQFLSTIQAVRVVSEAEGSSNQSTDQQNLSKQSTEANSQTVSANPVQTKVEFTLPQSETTSASRSEALMKEMQMLFKRSNFGQIGGSTRMLIKLYPEHLGQIRIELHETNGILSARILSSTAMAKEMLDSQMHQLRHAFNQQNLQVDRIDVIQSIQEPAKNEREQAFNEQFKREQQNEGKQQGNEETEVTFEEYLIELEV